MSTLLVMDERLPVAVLDGIETEDSIAAVPTSTSPQFLRARPGEPNALKTDAQCGCSPVRDLQSTNRGQSR